MSWIDIAWPMLGAVSLTLGLVHLLVWLRQPERYGYLWFFVTAASVATFSIFELRMMRAATPDEYATTLRWAHIPVTLVVFSYVAFVLHYLHSGRAWLGGAACALRALALALNFGTGVNINWAQVTAMVAVPVWGGDSVFVPSGVPNPYVLVAQASNLLLIAFAADAAVALWRRGDAAARRRALVVGGSMVLVPFAVALLAALLNVGAVRIPTALSVAFLIVVLVMAYELGWDLIDAAQVGERLRASEAQRRQGEHRLQLAANAAELGLWEWDVGSDAVWMTPECRALFGFDAAETVGLERFLASIHPPDRPAVEHDVRAALSGDGQDFEQDFRVTQPQGRVRWVRSRGRIERDDSGTATLVRGVSQDVTARKQAEGRFRALVEAAPSAMLVVDAGSRIALFNARARTMFGYAGDELVGVSIDALVPARLRSAHEAERQRYLKEPRARDMGAGRELFARRKDGSELAVEVGLTPLSLAEGDFVLASVVDVTQRRRDEVEAARQRDELAHLARVAMLSELSGSLAHELNQPLSAILSNAQAAQRFLARSPPQLDDVMQILDDIVRSDRRASAVITRLRSLLRKEESQHRPLDLNDVVAEALTLMRSDLVSRQVAVRTELAPRLPAVNGDRVQLQQVLLNLLINACDAMAGIEAYSEVVIRSEATSEAGVRVSVADRGPGIPPADLERVFDSFVTTKPQGLGLGLAVCRSIVKAHGGRLWAANGAGGGAILHLELPTTDA